jgi:hypothetical protein
MKLVVGTVVAGVLFAGIASAEAQSLADVARKEQARREEIKKPVKVYTDADVQKYQATTASQQAQATKVTALDAKGQPIGQQAAANGMPTDEAGWRARLQTARDGIDRTKLLLSALEQQAMRAKMRQGDADAAEGEAPSARDAEIKRLKAEIEQHQKVLANAEEDARQAGVPPGWVR